MKFMLEGVKELGYSQLVAVNGGCSGYCSGGYHVNGCFSKSVYSSNTATYSYSKNCASAGTPCESIYKSIADLSDKTKNAYVYGVNDCDIWVQKVLEKAGFNIASVWGDAAKYTVAEHEQKLAGKTTDDASNGWSIVLMTDSDKYSINHCGLIDVLSDGSVVFYQNTKSAGGPTVEKYNTVKDFQNAYAYNDFDYFKLCSN